MESKETNQDLPVRKRQANKENFIQTPKGIRVIRLPIREAVYHKIVSQPKGSYLKAD
jgi:hypothetical protein